MKNSRIRQVLLLSVLAIGLVLASIMVWRSWRTRQDHQYSENLRNIRQEMADQHFSRAINLLQTLLKSGKFDSSGHSKSEIYYELGMCMASLGQPARAIEEFGRVEQSSPFYPQAMAPLATIHINTGQYRLAEEALKSGLEYLHHAKHHYHDEQLKR